MLEFRSSFVERIRRQVYRINHRRSLWGIATTAALLQPTLQLPIPHMFILIRISPGSRFFSLFFVLFFLIQLRGKGDFLHELWSCRIFSSFSKIKKIKPKKKLDNFWLALSALFEFRVSSSSRPSLICVRVDRYCMILPLYPGKTFRHLLKIFCKKNIKSVSHKSPKIDTTVYIMKGCLTFSTFIFWISSKLVKYTYGWLQLKQHHKTEKQALHMSLD